MNNKSVLYLNTLRFGELAVFCGAGISKNSGLPMANELKQFILEKLSIDKEDLDEVMNSDLPFEAFMETLSENSDISRLLDIFEDGEPNTNHILMAKLAKNGYLKTIFTANFDLLIEKALEKEGLGKGVDFEVYCDEEQFSEVDFGNLNKISIFKIHGSVDNEESIRTTLKAVASKSLSDKRMNVIRYLFSTGNHKKVLILGYSCSDEFDLTPQLQSIEENQKEVIFVEHSGIERMEDIKIKDVKNPFKKFSGKRIKCDTDKFLEKLWDSLKEIVGEYKFINSGTKWNIYVDDWIKELEENRSLFVVGSIVYNISNFKRAIEYFEKSLEIAKKMGDNVGEFDCYASLGDSCLGDFGKVIVYYEKSLEIAKKIGDRTKESGCYTGLGNAYSNLGDLNKAIKYHKKSLEIVKEIGDKSGESGCYTGLGNAYHNLGLFNYNLEYLNKAIEYYEKSLELHKEIGDKSGESGCYKNLGSVYDNLGNLNESIEYHEKAIEYHKMCLVIDKQIGNKAGQSVCYRNLGAAYDGRGDFKKAFECYNKSLEIDIETGDKAGESVCYYNLGCLYYNSRDLNTAVQYFEKSLEIDIEIKNKVGESDCCTALGNAYFYLREFDKAVQYYENSIEIDEETGNKVGQSVCYTSLGNTYYKLEDFNAAIEYYLRAEKIFKETGRIPYLKQIYEYLSLAYEKIGDDEKAEDYKSRLSGDTEIL